MPPALAVRRARAAGLDRLAITDHGAIDGALEARSIDPELVIVGEEICCGCGTELIGLFLHELIPMGLPIEETVRRIRDQGGLVYVPHPYAYLRRIEARATQALALADVMEVFNSRAFYRGWNRRATVEAQRLGIPAAAGSDSHHPWEYGRAYTEMPAFIDAAGCKLALREARPVGRVYGSALLHVLGVSLHGARALIGRGHGIPLVRRSVRPRALVE